MITDFPTAPLAPGLRGAGGSTVEKSLSASHTEILTLPATTRNFFLLFGGRDKSPEEKFDAT